MKDNLLLIGYILSVILLTAVHDVQFFIFFLSLLFILSGKEVFSILKKTVLSVIVFNSIISISYIVLSIIKNTDWLDYITLINLRVITITFMTFLFVKKVNIIKALSFSKTARYLLSISYSQILTYRRSFTDFKHALKSRSVKPDRKDIYNFVSAVFMYFLNKSFKDSREISQAMKSRGFFIE
ncbi:CbiQ family ECF transporter T component [Persephonella sp.]